MVEKSGDGEEEEEEKAMNRRLTERLLGRFGSIGIDRN